MANKGPSYGLSRQVQDKIDKKYDPDLEVRLVEWIAAQCGPGVGQPGAGKQGFQDWLKDGVVSSTEFVYLKRLVQLCVRIVVLSPDLIKLRASLRGPISLPVVRLEAAHIMLTSRASKPLSYSNELL